MVSVGLSMLASACAASYRAAYDGDLQFEHCYRLDEERAIPTPHKRACWQRWAQNYGSVQSSNRLQYALGRDRVLAASGSPGGQSNPSANAPSAQTPQAANADSPRAAGAIGGAIPVASAGSPRTSGYGNAPAGATPPMLPPPFGETSGNPSSNSASQTAPIAWSAFASPPATVAPAPANNAPAGAAPNAFVPDGSRIASPEWATPPGTRCGTHCGGAWAACGQVCNAAACKSACDESYRTCMRQCF